MSESNPIEEHPDNVPEAIDDPSSPDVEEPDQTPYPDVDIEPDEDEDEPEDDREDEDEESDR